MSEAITRAFTKAGLDVRLIGLFACGEVAVVTMGLIALVFVGIKAADEETRQFCREIFHEVMELIRNVLIRREGRK
jgi:hypothetical protein